MKKTSMVLAIIASVAAGSFAVGANAETNDAKRAAMMQSVKVPLSDAIATAERQTGGKAYDAGIENERSGALIKIKTHGPTGKQVVYVDPGTGAITGRPADADDD